MDDINKQKLIEFVQRESRMYEAACTDACRRAVEQYNRTGFEESLASARDYLARSSSCRLLADRIIENIHKYWK